MKILENVIWEAIEEHPEWAVRDNNAGIFLPQLSPLAGLTTVSEQAMEELWHLCEKDRKVLIFSHDPLPLKESWKMLDRDGLLQMVWKGNEPENTHTPKIVPLTELHIPQMLELTALTRPGPFELRTIDFGQYYGIFEGDQLVCMAGWRLQAAEYKEISALCTHPDFLGRGYAAGILKFMVSLTLNNGYKPFLHVKKDNIRAVGIYQKLGFELSKDYFYNFIQKVN